MNGPAAPPETRDGLEPPGVAAGRVALAVTAVFGLLALSLGAILAFTTVALRAPTTARARPFPVPALETSVAPRMAATRGPGPGSDREPPADERASRLGEPDPALAAAERALAARGPRAYDPPVAKPGR